MVISTAHGGSLRDIISHVYIGGNFESSRITETQVRPYKDQKWSVRGLPCESMPFEEYPFVSPDPDRKTVYH